MISVGYRYSGETGVQLNGEEFCTSIGVDLCGGKFEVDWGNQGTRCQGTLPTDLIV